MDRRLVVPLLALAGLMAPSAASAQLLDQNCTVTFLNRTVQVNPNGTFSLPEVPVDVGQYRARVVCRRPDGRTETWVSGFITLVPNGQNELGPLMPGENFPIPLELQLVAFPTVISTRGQTVQLTVRGIMPDGTPRDLSRAIHGTTYASSNAQIATVSRDGLVTGLKRGQVVISARNEGVLGSILFNITIPADADGDGMSDDFERANGLNAGDPSDAPGDLDNDGLSNLQESQRGTNPRAADTDGDGVADGVEITRGTSPLDADSDDDSLSDGAEAQRGTNPLDPDSDDDGVPDGVELQLGTNPTGADTTTSVTGRVIVSQSDGQGGTQVNPVVGATVQVFNTFSAQTNSTGGFTIPNVPTGLGNIIAFARLISSGQVFEGVSLGFTPVAGGVTDVQNIELARNSGGVSGFITGPNNQPVVGAQITVVSGADRRTATSTIGGFYRIANLQGGPLTVTAIDPRTGLRGRAAGVLLANQVSDLSLNMALGPSGTVRGTVFNRDGSPVGAGIAVQMTGAAALNTTTDGLGQFLFDFVPLAPFALTAQDQSTPNPNRGRTDGALTQTGQVAVVDVSFLGRGTVNVLVQNADSTPAATATVNLSSQSVFGGSRTGATDGQGRVSFFDIFVGNVSVSAQKSPTGGQASGNLANNGDTLNLTITLTNTGTIDGRVFRAGGTTPVQGARVDLSNGRTTTTASDGFYRFELVPVGTYDIDVTDLSTGDRGRTTGVLLPNTNPSAATRNITMLGQGSVTVEVRDGSNSAVSGAQVLVSSNSQFGGQQQGTTDATGQVTFQRVFVGGYTASATNPLTQLSGQANGTAVLNSSVTTRVNLTAAGTVNGIVVASDGTTRVSNVAIHLVGPVHRHINNPANGEFQFQNVPVNNNGSPYQLQAVDSGGYVIGTSSNIVLDTQGDKETRTVTLIARGSVSGLVTNPDNSPSTGTAVWLNAAGQGPAFARNFQVFTDVNGRYQIAGVPIGPFSATASRQQGVQQLFAAGNGSLTQNGQNATLNLQLSASLIPTTTTLYDANNFEYNLRENGSLQDGTRQVFGGDFNTNRGAMLLDIVTNNGGNKTANRFSGQGFGTSEEDGREIAIQQNLAGLSVTRKVYVPLEGYFARYLEVLNNPTSNPITVDVRVTNHSRFISKVQNGFRFDREPRIITSSNGDSFFDVFVDNWLVLDDDENLDPFLVGSSLPSVAHIFQGAGAADQYDFAEFDNQGQNYGRLVYEWQNVTIPPGGTIAFLHFASQETVNGAAQAAAQRLVQLPPEALAGLTEVEGTAIRNFVIPAGRVSTLPALPALRGAVTGRALNPDNSTVPGASVTYRSAHALFGRTWSFGANGQGEFRLNSQFNNGNSIPIPVMNDAEGPVDEVAYTLQARHSESGLFSPETTGGFEQGLIVGTRDITFTNSGLLRGTVRRSNGAVVTNGFVTISGGELGSNGLAATLTSPIDQSGEYRFSGIPESTESYLLVASVSHPQGTPLTATGNGQVINLQTRTADLTLPGVGGVQGIVRHSVANGGGPAVNLAVQLNGGGLSRTTRTDTGGRYSFTDVYVGPATVETADQSTNPSTAAQALVAIVADQMVTQDLTLTVGGIVTGVVRLNNQVVANATVTIQHPGGTLTRQTSPQGVYRVEGITPGAINVVGESNGIRGYNAGQLGLSGETLTLDINLYPGGTVRGQVFRFGGTIPVAGAQVSIDRFVPGLPSTDITDAEGRYEFVGVSVGSFTINVLDPVTGDRGRATNAVNANGEIRVINVTLNGLGTVNVTVKDSSGQNNVIGANVTVQGTGTFAGYYQGTTNNNGVATFDNVFAGGFSASAYDQSTGLFGSTNGTVTAGGTANVTVTMQPAANLGGTVSLVNGSPASGGVVRLLYSWGGFFRQVNVASDGSYRFDSVPLATYSVDTLDPQGRVRARVNGLTLNVNGQTFTQNLTYVGLGSVVGVVRNPNGSVATGLTVQVRSGNSAIGGFFSTTTDTDGSYRVNSVPVGPFNATASNPGQQLLGETNAQITQDGQEVTANIQLLNNGISMPRYRYDANDFYFHLQGNGSVRDATNSVFGGDFSTNYGAFFLDVIRNGSSTAFTGGTTGTQEDSGRELAVRQNGLGGLDVVRKMFIPNTGYFVRYLEELTNPTSDPITVDVRVVSNMWGYQGLPRIISTSSNDATIDVSNPDTADLWAVLDDNQDNDPSLVYGPPAVAFVFDGPEAQESVDAASFSNPAQYGQLQYRWNGITVPPGGRVILMHFGAQQSSRAGARASAERLVQLPPEALAGLGADEIADIRNFVMPPGGASTLNPIAVNGSIAGQVFEGDGVTPAPFATVRFRSNNPIYGRVRSIGTNNLAAYSLNSTFPTNPDFSGAVAIPLEPFTVFATHPQNSNIVSPNFVGGFAAQQTGATQNVVFTNTGILRGVLMTAAGTAVTSGQVVVQGGSPFQSRVVNVDAQGRFAFGGLWAGSYTLTGTMNSTQCCIGVQGTQTATVVAAQSTTANITLPPTGIVSGVVRNGGGTGQAGVFVRLHTPSFSFYRQMNSTTGGAYQLIDIPPGTYTLYAQEPVTGILSSTQVTVTANQTTTQDLTLIGLGTVSVQVNLAGGGPASGSNVYVQEAARGTSFRFVGNSDALGRITVTNVAVGSFTIRAHHPQNTSLNATTTGAIASHGQSVSVTVALPAVGTIAGRVTRHRSGGVAVSSAFVQVFDQTTGEAFGSALTDANGNYSIANQPAARVLRLTARDPLDSALIRTVLSQTIPSNGATLTANIELLALATVRVSVVQASGQPLTGARVEVHENGRNHCSSCFRHGGNDIDDGTNDGVVTVANVAEGAFSLRAFTSTGGNAGSTTGTVALADDGQTLTATINAPLSGDIQGTVFAGDGTTRVPFASIAFLNADTNQSLGSTSTNANGQYSRVGLTATNVIVRVFPPNGGTAVDRNVTFTSTGQVVTLNVTLPVSVITGTIRFSDLTPVPFPSVNIAADRTYFAQSTDAAGHYTIIGPPVGDFLVNAQDNGSALMAVAQGTVVSVSTPVTVDVTLPPTGTVSGTIFNADGSPVPFADVSLVAGGAAWDRWAQSDSSGVFTFQRVPVGRGFILQACVYDPFQCGSAGGDVATAGSTLTVNITLPGVGNVVGTLRNENGDPVAGAVVEIAGVANGGPMGVTQTSTTTDNAGQFRFDGLSAGAVRVTGRDPVQSNNAGVSIGTVVRNVDTTVNVSLGNAFRFGQLFLDGADGFRYDLDCDAALDDGGTTNGNLDDAYDGTWYLIDGAGQWSLYFDCVTAARLEDSGREAVFGPASFAGPIQATRKVFVPSSGGFARYLEVLENKSNTEVKLSVQIWGNLGSDGSTRVVVAPSATNNTYAVTREDFANSTDPALAHVFAGPGATIGVTRTQFFTGEDDVYYNYDVTIPANGQAILMHFAVQRNPTDTAAAQTQAQALVNLTDPNALTGMTQAEKNAVKNFRITP